MPLSPGDKLGPHEILSALGAGGMGEVYKARDTRLDRTVAIKVLPEHIAQREDLRVRFEREARAVASLKHPNICVLHDIGNHDGVGSYMVMELLEGETASRRVALPLDQVLKLATQIADALDRAHRDAPGDHAKARGLLSEALTMYESMEMPFHAKRTWRSCNNAPGCGWLPQTSDGRYQFALRGQRPHDPSPPVTGVRLFTGGHQSEHRQYPHVPPHGRPVTLENGGQFGKRRRILSYRVEDTNPLGGEHPEQVGGVFKRQTHFRKQPFAAIQFSRTRGRSRQESLGGTRAHSCDCLNCLLHPVASRSSPLRAPIIRAVHPESASQAKRSR